MLAERYFRSLRRVLFTHGIMGQPAARLVAEMRDHLALKQGHFLQAGATAAEAEEKACAALGEPDVVAARAAETLQQGSWIARRPICFGLAVGLGALLINFVTVVVVGAICVHLLDRLTDLKWPAAQVAVLILNWLPVLFGFGTLAWIAQHRATGWRSLAWGAGLLIFFTTFPGTWTAHQFPPSQVFDHRTVGLTFDVYPMEIIRCEIYRIHHSVPPLMPVPQLIMRQGTLAYFFRLLLTLAIVPIFRLVPPLFDRFFEEKSRA